MVINSTFIVLSISNLTLREWITDKAYCPTCKVPIINDVKQKRLSHFRHNSTDETQVQNAEDEKSNKLNENTPNVDSDLRKIKNYQNVMNIVRWVETQENIPTDENPISINQVGSVTYSLPCAAVYDRSFANEISRLQIEIYNKKILEMYQNPNKAYSVYEEELNKIRKSINNK